jgi:hypothetical protein
MKPGPLPVDRRYKSSIPANAKPRPGIISGDSTSKRVDYYLHGKHVGWRDWDEDGHLELEVPLRNGQLHGTRYSWYFDGVLTSAEPYYENKPHGVAKQWAMTGKLIGTYKMVHGTGIDLWRGSIDGKDEGPYCLSAVLYFKDGTPDGFHWMINSDQKSVWSETHRWEGRFHGIERQWNSAGRLRRGYPKFFIHGEQVTKRRYLVAAAKESTLPPFREADNKPARKFPPEIQRHLLTKAK